MFTKPLIFVVASFLVFTVIYSSYSFSAFWASAAGPISCRYTGTVTVTCCQDHVINQSPTNPAGTLVTYCTDCEVAPGGRESGAPGYSWLRNCSERYIAAAAAEPTPPPTGPLTPGNLQNVPTLEQVPTTTPPLFGETPGGGAEQPPTLTPTQPTPDTGGSTTQPRPPQTVTPEITEDDNQGGGLPNIQSRPNIQSEGEITAQPEDEESQNEDDGQEGSETPGPLT